jgi:hypothetical protein
VELLTAGRVADLTPELLDTVPDDLTCLEAVDADLADDAGLDAVVDLDTEDEVDLDVLEPLPVLLACAKASD